MKCRTCKIDMVPGKALQQTATAGMLDFPGDTKAVTFSVGGPGKLVDCVKCPQCGYSVES